jgi:hypothetical protein
MPDPSAAAPGAASLTKGRLLAGTMVPSTICGVLAIAVSLVRHRPIGSVFEAGLPATTQFAAGVLGGAGAGVLGATLLLRSKIFSDARALASSALASAWPGGAARAIYIAFVFAVSLGLDWLFEREGLGAAMVAHATTDLTILLTAQRVLA